MNQTFERALRSTDFVVTAELPLPDLLRRTELDRVLEELAPAVHAVQIADGRGASPCISAVAAAAIARQAGVDPLLHLNCRDRNRQALQSDLFGAAALGVCSLLLYRGRKLGRRRQRATKGVFDVSGDELIAMAAATSDALVAEGGRGFLLGAAATAFDPEESWEPRRMLEKSRQGVAFVQTQSCLNVTLLRDYLSQLVAAKLIHNVSVIVTLPLPRSADEAREINRTRGRGMVPPPIVERLAAAGDPPAEATTIVAGVLGELRSIPGIAGANIAFRGDAARVLEVIRRSAERLS